MLAATRMSRLRISLAVLHPVQRWALLIWIGMIVAVSARVGFSRNGAGSVFPVYRTAAHNWLLGADLYTLDFSKPCFRYHPLIAPAFAPLNLLPEKAASIFWRWLGIALMLGGMAAFLRQFHVRDASAEGTGWYYLLAAPLALQSLNNGQANPAVIGLILLGLVAFERKRWNLSALLIAGATVFKLYPIAIGLLLAISNPRAFSPRFALALLAGCLLPFALQRPDYVVGQYRLWIEYLFADARQTGVIAQAPRDLFLLLRFWSAAPPQWLYRALQLGTAAGIAWLCRRLATASDPALRAQTLPAILHFGCIWMTVLGPSTESCTYTLLAPTAALLLMGAMRSSSRLAVICAVSGYTLLVLPTVAAAFPGGTTVQHWGPQPLGALLLIVPGLVQVRTNTTTPATSSPASVPRDCN